MLRRLYAPCLDAEINAICEAWELMDARRRSEARPATPTEADSVSDGGSVGDHHSVLGTEQVLTLHRDIGKALAFRFPEPGLRLLLQDYAGQSLLPNPNYNGGTTRRWPWRSLSLAPTR